MVDDGDDVVVKATAPSVHIFARNTTHVTVEKVVVLSENDESVVYMVTSKSTSITDRYYCPRTRQTQHEP